MPEGSESRQGDRRDQEAAGGARGLTAPLPLAGGERPLHPDIRHEPDPHHPGWWTWDLPDDSRFNAAIGKLLVRGDGPGRARCRMFPERAHSNLGNAVHGGAILTLIDMAMFSGGYVAGVSNIHAVTLDCSAQFVSAAELGQPLDAIVELLRETGRLVFLRGTVEQEGRVVAAWTGTLRKIGS